MADLPAVWKELKKSGDDEHIPLAQAYGSSAASSSSAAYKTTGSSWEEDGYWDTGLTLRELGPQAIRVWLGLQIVALVFQMLLWSEVSGHLYDFDEAVARECGPGRSMHGICAGPMWNVATWQDFVLGGEQRPMTMQSAQSFTFSTASMPPTFLLVVDPVTKARAGQGDPEAALDDIAQQDDLKDVAWSIEVVRANPPQIGPPLKRVHSGQEALSFEDLSSEAGAAMAAAGRVEWRATLMVRSYTRSRVRFVAFVEDATAQHLQQVHDSPQCAFGRSWKSFNEQHQGRSHQALSWCRFLLGNFLVLGGLSVYIVFKELEKKGPMGYRFHALVAAKFFLQDVPQQVCMVLYLLGWYEVSGLRCQLCLFDAKHCSAESAFHLANLVAVACTLLSSVSNQLLVRSVRRRIVSEDDVCLRCFLRVVVGCVSVLPFTTGMCAASRTVLPGAGFFHVVLAVPCGVGWMAVFGGLVFGSMLCCCDEDYDGY